MKKTQTEINAERHGAVSGRASRPLRSTAFQPSKGRAQDGADAPLFERRAKTRANRPFLKWDEGKTRIVDESRSMKISPHGFCLLQFLHDSALCAPRGEERHN